MAEPLLPKEITEAASEAAIHLLPEKSKVAYLNAYDAYKKWQITKNTTASSEPVLLVYFTELSQKYKPNSLWAIYSMLKSTIHLKEDIRIETYFKLQTFLKRKTEGYEPKRSNTFTTENIKTFLSNAKDIKYLALKVALILGISGACSSQEMYCMKLSDIEDLGSSLVVNIPRSSKSNARRFTLRDNFYDTCKRYISGRSAETNVYLFHNYRSGKIMKQRIGINAFTQMGRDIAKFLDLENPEQYTGHSLRRSAQSIQKLEELSSGVTSNMKFLSEYDYSGLSHEQATNLANTWVRQIMQLKAAQQSFTITAINNVLSQAALGYPFLDATSAQIKSEMLDLNQSNPYDDISDNIGSVHEFVSVSELQVKDEPPEDLSFSEESSHEWSNDIKPNIDVEPTSIITQKESSKKIISNNEQATGLDSNSQATSQASIDPSSSQTSKCKRILSSSSLSVPEEVATKMQKFDRSGKPITKEAESGISETEAVVLTRTWVLKLMQLEPGQQRYVIIVINQVLSQEASGSSIPKLTANVA